MSVIVKTNSILEQGDVANIFTSGLLETDTVSASKNGNNVSITWKVLPATHNLPAGYTELPYLESSGTQHIDTEVAATNNIKAVVNLVSCSQSGSYRLLSSESSWISNAFNIGANWVCWNTTNFSTTSYNDGNKHTIVLDKNKLYVDGTLVNTFTNATFTGYSLYLFAGNRAGSVIEYVTAKIGIVELYSSDVLVRYFVPAQRNSDSALGMYDTVNNVFHTNQGTGSFTTGSFESCWQINNIGEYGDYIITACRDVATKSTTTKVDAADNYSVDCNPALTSSNIDNYFTIANNNYYFAGSGSTWTSNNKNVNNSTAQSTWTAKQNMNVKMDWSVSSEANYDKLTITAGGETKVNAVSGVQSGTITFALTAGQTIVLVYKKDQREYGNEDIATVSNILIY